MRRYCIFWKNGVLSFQYIASTVGSRRPNTKRFFLFLPCHQSVYFQFIYYNTERINTLPTAPLKGGVSFIKMKTVARSIIHFHCYCIMLNLQQAYSSSLSHNAVLYDIVVIFMFILIPRIKSSMCNNIPLINLGKTNLFLKHMLFYTVLRVCISHSSTFLLYLHISRRFHFIHTGFA